MAVRQHTTTGFLYINIYITMEWREVYTAGAAGFVVRSEMMREHATASRRPLRRVYVVCVCTMCVLTGDEEEEENCRHRSSSRAVDETLRIVLSFRD
jgi:hypothetical protein